ncbi:MAG: PEP-CTERM sorting domain-containing protein [Candidatus Acidiferrales bacterium]
MRIHVSALWRPFLIVLCLLIVPSGLRASTVYNNLGSTSDGSDPISSFGPLADSFATGSSNFSFDSLTVLLDVSSTDSSGSVTASLLSNNSGAPGSSLLVLGTVSDLSLSTSLTDYTFSFSTYTLLADTTYWIQLSSSNGSVAYWAWSLDQSAQGVAGQFFSNEDGVFPNTDGPYQMEVGGTGTSATPEPSSLFLAFTGLLGLAPLRRKLL